jgi:hypothetical protein
VSLFLPPPPWKLQEVIIRGVSNPDLEKNETQNPKAFLPIKVELKQCTISSLYAMTSMHPPPPPPPPPQL